jgi:hypothetical protein
MSRYGARVALTWQKAGLPPDASNHLVDVMVTSLIVVPAKLVQVIASGTDAVDELPAHPAIIIRTRIRNSDHTTDFLFIFIIFLE